MRISPAVPIREETPSESLTMEGHDEDHKKRAVQDSQRPGIIGHSGGEQGHGQRYAAGQSEDGSEEVLQQPEGPVQSPACAAKMALEELGSEVL